MSRPRPILHAAERLGALAAVGRAVRQQATKSILEAPQSYVLFVRVAELKLDTETLSALDAIFPPYKTAPEHYAW